MIISQHAICKLYLQNAHRSVNFVMFIFTDKSKLFKRIQNCPDNLINELNSRYDAIKIQSLVHVLCAPKFKKHDPICMVRVK